MSKELIENLLEYADIAEAGEKSHWALAMRQAAEYIRADLDKPLPERVKLDEKMLEHFTCKKVERKFDGVEEPFVLYYTKMWTHQTYQLYENEAAALWHNLGKALGYAEPLANKPLPEPFTHIGAAAFEKLNSGYAMSVFCSKSAINNLDVPLYAEPSARSPMPDVEISKAFCDESGVSIGDTIEDAFEAGVRFGEQYHSIKEQE